MESFRFADFELNVDQRVLTQGGQRVAVEGRTLDFLLYLVHHRERVVPRSELLSRVWADVTVSEQSVPQTLYEVRKLLGDEPQAPRFIETVRGRGLRFIADVTVQLPRGQSLPADPFVGREDALEELESALELARSSGGRLVLVAGEAGIGKTRLSSEFAARARRRGALAHIGRCIEADGAPPYWPWMTLLREHGRFAASGSVEQLVQEAPAFSQIAPELVPASERQSPAVQEEGPALFQLFDAMTRFWREAAEDKPLVLILDDASRADEPSRRLLLHLTRELPSTRLLVLATHREPSAESTASWEETAALLAREACTASILLDRFTVPEVRTYLERARGGLPTDAEVERLHARSTGNPFFLAQLVRLSGGADAGLPRTLNEAVTHQLAGLSPSCRSLLATAALMGRDFSLEVLLRAHESELSVEDELSAAVRAGVLVDDPERSGRLRFSHVLVRDALETAQSAGERARRHAAITDALEQRRTGARLAPGVQELSRIAHHAWEARSVRGARSTVESLARAGRAAIPALAYEDAVTNLSRAVELASAAGVTRRHQFDLLLALGEAQARAYRRDEARETFRAAAELAKRLGQPEDLAELALRISPGFFSIEVGVRDPFTESLLEEALALLPESDSPLRARAMARLAMALYWSDEHQRRFALLQEAEEIGERLEDPATSAHVLSAWIVARWSPATLDERLEGSERLIRMATSAEEWELVLIGRVYRFASLVEAGELGAAEREVHLFERSVTDHAIPQALWYADLFRANLSNDAGRLDKAAGYLKRIESLGRRLEDVNIDQSLGAHLLILALRRGEAGALLPAIQTMVERYAAVPGWRAAEALVNLEAGRRQEAWETLSSVMGPRGDGIPHDLFRVVVLTVAGQVVSSLEDRPLAEWIRQHLEPYADRYASGGYGSFSWGSVARVLGCLCRVTRDWDDGDAFFHRAETLESRGGSRSWLTDTYREHARLLLERKGPGDEARAAELLDASHQLALELGLSHAAGQAEQAARAAGVMLGEG